MVEEAKEPLTIDLECYHCGNKWQRQFYGDLERFMAKHRNSGRMCPKCGELGVPVQLKQEIKQDLQEPLEPYEGAKFQPGDIVEVKTKSWFRRNQQGVVVFVRDWQVAVHLPGMHFNQYQYFPETALTLVKKREAQTKMAMLVDCFAYLIKTANDELDQLLEQLKTKVMAQDWYGVGELVAELEITQHNPPSNAMDAILSFKYFHDPALRNVRVPLDGWTNFTLGYATGRNFTDKQIEWQLKLVKDVKQKWLAKK